MFIIYCPDTLKETILEILKWKATPNSWTLDINFPFVLPPFSVEWLSLGQARLAKAQKKAAAKAAAKKKEQDEKDKPEEEGEDEFEEDWGNEEDWGDEEEEW